MKCALDAEQIIPWVCTAAPAGEPFFKAGDVIAYVGGEDMVVAAELGYLETLIQLALPEHRLKFRSLAREGDTVFEQRRDLNYPKLETQLDTIGATVVICQFGQMESLAGKEKLPEFIAAYEKLIARVKGKDGARKVAIAAPMHSDGYIFMREPLPPEIYETALPFQAEVAKFAKHIGVPYLDSLPVTFRMLKSLAEYRGIDMKTVAHRWWASSAARDLANVKEHITEIGNPPYSKPPQPNLTTLVTAKNRLWFHYYRPQNWAFLAGDRTNQPSSRDHLDPSKRWFPDELAKFLPLVEAKDAEIWALAKKLSAEGGK